MMQDDAWRDAVALSGAAEQGLLGSLLLSPAAYDSAAHLVRPDHFVEPVHRAIFESIAGCRKAGRAGSFGDIKASLGGALLSNKVAPEIDLAHYLARLREDGATASSALDYAKSVRANFALRSMMAAVLTDKDAGLPEDRVRAAFDKLDLLRAEMAEGDRSRVAIGDIGREVLDRAVAISQGAAHEPGVTTGLIDLDRAILGYRPGELVIVAGRPGMGKTTVATSSALQTSAVTLGNRRGGVLFFGLELGREAIGARCLSDIGFQRHESPTHSAIRSGQISAAQLPGLRAAEQRLADCALEIDGRSAITVGEIEASCRAAKRRFEQAGQNLAVVFVDYLKQVRATDRYRGQRVYEVGEITAGLRDIAKRLELCVVLLVQLNRAVESREDKRPMLADLRESGDLENDADVVALLYRPAYYLKRELQAADPDAAVALAHKLEMAEHELEVIVAKNRNGEGEHTVRAFVDIGRSAVRSAARSR